MNISKLVKKSTVGRKVCISSRLVLGVNTFMRNVEKLDLKFYYIEGNFDHSCSREHVAGCCQNTVTHFYFAATYS